MPSIPARSPSHGGWALPLSGEADKRLRRLLADGATAAAAAESVGVAEGYVLALIEDERHEKVAARALPEPPASEPAEQRSRVDCIVAGAEIGARECIDRQCSTRCFCPRATFAINAMSPHALPGNKLSEQLDKCRSVALKVHRLPVDERYLGDAAVVHAGGKVPPKPLFAGELPVPPKRVDREPLITAKPEVEREEPAEEQEPARPKERIGPLLSLPPTEGKRLSQPRTEPAPRAPEEKKMPPRSKLNEATDADVKAQWARSPSVKALSEHFESSWKSADTRARALGLLNKMPDPLDGYESKAAKPAPAIAAKPKASPAPAPAPSVMPALSGGDVVEFLTARKAQLLAEAERIDRALAALTGAA